MSASSFLALRGRWGKAGGCETELSPNSPVGGGVWGNPSAGGGTQLGSEKQLLGLPSKPPFPPSPARPLSRRSADSRMVPGVGKLLRHTHSLPGHPQEKAPAPYQLLQPFPA